uniref:Uncharacterized protein n=1 Tax=Aegilops tauschii subsp. strangulata TaxID=200361 RepID=A0A453ECE4_AEGTS
MKVSASTTSDTANQAQSKRAPAPHMFREIVAGEKVTNVASEHGLCFKLSAMVQKYWVDERTRHNCFMLFPRGLAITWSEEPQYWTWQPHVLKLTCYHQCCRSWNRDGGAEERLLVGGPREAGTAPSHTRSHL